MIEIKNTKFVSITPPGAIVDNAGYTTASIDTKGYSHARVVVYLGATDIALAALKLRQSDDDSSYSDITGADFSVSGTLPSATDDNKFFAVDVDLRGKKRYLDLTATAGDGSTGTYLTAFAILSRPAESPNSATEQGFSQILSV